jgi:hypothetical protein
MTKSPVVGLMAMSVMRPSAALVAAEPSPLVPDDPEPATVEMTPVVRFTRRTTRLP